MYRNYGPSNNIIQQESDNDECSDVLPWYDNSQTNGTGSINRGIGGGGRRSRRSTKSSSDFHCSPVSVSTANDSSSSSSSCCDETTTDDDDNAVESGYWGGRRQQQQQNNYRQTHRQKRRTSNVHVVNSTSVTSPQIRERSVSSLASSQRRSDYNANTSSDDDDHYHRNYMLWQEEEEVTANPQSPGDDELRIQQLQELVSRDSSPPRSMLPQHQPQYMNGYGVSKSSSSCSNKRSHKIPLLLLGFIVVGFIAVGIAEISANNAAAQVTKLEVTKEQIDARIRTYEKDIRSLERELEAMDILIQQNQQQQTDGSSNDTPSHSHESSNDAFYEAQHQRALDEMNMLQIRLRKEAQQAIALKKEVQIISKEDLVQKYGTGTIRVELQLVFPPENHSNSMSRSKKPSHTNHPNGGPTKFVIELAPIDMMPHSIHTFLEMVSNQLLDGCSFILNALHVLKAAPLPYDGSSAAEKARAFSMHGLESVAFKEYNELYPHKQYTVGFAADGSPSFYINTEDNSEIHVGDPCFGKVVDGFDTIHRLEASPTRNGIWFEKRIGIQKATILTS